MKADSTGRCADLVAALARHRPSDPEERGHVARMSALLESASDPLSRTHYEPGHFTASAFVLSPDGAQLLLILHGKLGLWLQPGGHVDPTDPTMAAAAMREVREETGLADVELVEADLFDVDIHSIPAIGGAPTHEHFDVRFLLRAGTEGIGAGSDAREARWVPLGEMESVASDASVMRAVGKLRRRRR